MRQSGWRGASGWKNESGQTVILTAVCLTAILGFVGLATDVGVLLHAKRNLQIAADAAALAGANEININNTTAAIKAQGKSASASNGFTDGVNGTTVNVYPPPVDGPNTGTPGYVEAVVTQTQPTFFMRLFSFTSVPVSARAVAFNGASNGSGCLHALNTSAPAAIDLSGHFTVDAPGCQVLDNSNANCALQFTGNAGSLTAGSVSVAGTVCGFPTDSNPLPQPHAPPVSDPLANTYKPLTAAQIGTCSAAPSGNSWAPATPGGIVCYSGNISISNAVTMASGTYVFTGSLGLQGHGSLTGPTVASGSDGTTGVTIYLAAPNGNMNMSGAGNASMNLSGGSTAFPNLVIYQEPADTNPVNMEGTPITALNGIVYLPSAALELGGNGNLSQTLNADFIVNTFVDFGDATVNITDFSATHNTVLHTIALVE